jgi:F-type H+-transporting ATPase subunit b
MPQFDFANVFTPQLFWLAVFFVVLYFGIVRLTLPRLDKVMTEREDTISGDLASARAAKEAADQVAEEYRASMAQSRAEAQGVIARAKDEAAKASEKRIAAADKRLAKKLAEAEAEIEAARQAASEHVREIAADGAQAIVAKLTGESVSRDAVLGEVDAQLTAA